MYLEFFKSQLCIHFPQLLGRNRESQIFINRISIPVVKETTFRDISLAIKLTFSYTIFKIKILKAIKLLHVVKHAH